MSTLMANRIDINGRDVACFLFALGVHSLLLLWQGGALVLPEKTSDLGEMVTDVRFLDQVPDYDVQPQGGSAPKPHTFAQRFRQLFKGHGAAQPKKTDLAMGQVAQPIAPPKPMWKKADVLSDKSFSEKHDFKMAATKEDALSTASMQAKAIQVKTSQGDFKVAQPNLKENKFRVAKADVPFPILKPKSQDALVNVNAIPMNVGRTTSDSIRSLDSGGGMAAAPAMKSKSFSKSASMSGGFGGMGSASGSGGAGGTQLAMGNAGGASSPIEGASSGFGSGSSYGSTRNGAGAGSGAASGRTWSRGGGTGAASMVPLERHTVSDQPAGLTETGSKNSGFSITGALRNRGIEHKTLPPYEVDGRVALRFRVDWSGRVLDGTVVEISSGSPSFDQKVIAALKQWVFNRLPSSRTNEIQEGVITFVFKGV